MTAVSTTAPELHRDLIRFEQWRKRMLARSPERYVYMIQHGTHGPVKLGIARDPADRLKTLQQGNPNELHGLCAWLSFPEEERALHLALAEFRIRGEWFKPVPDVLNIHGRLYANEFAPWDDPHWDFLDEELAA